MEISRRKVLACLAYLAVTARRHSRDELAELLFGRQDREHARGGLRQTLSLLRKAVGEERVGTDRARVWLSPGAGFRLDVAEFRRLLKSGNGADGRGDRLTAASRLARAAGLYRGEFLSGFYTKDSAAFENWQLLTQESLRQQQASALRRLVAIHAAEGRYQESIDFARRWLALDPLEEEVHRQLMRLHSLAGQRLEALRQYESCRTVLERELGEKPDDETERLREQILSRRLLPAAEPRGLKRSGEPGPSPARLLSGSPPESLYLFGRISDAGREPQAQQERRLREAIGQERGRILDAGGKTLCAVFPAPEAAIRAALGAQVRPPTAKAGSGIAILAGDPARRQAPPRRLAERAAMLLDASWEGQILLNESAAELAVGTELPEGTTLRCLGAHRLKDLGPARPTYLVEYPGLGQGLHGLDTLDCRPNNLETQPTWFIGREEELAAVQGALGLEEVRLLTLTGPAGTGKTRLALQAAAGLYERFPQGIFVVDLAPLREPGQVAGAIAAALNIREGGGVGRTLLETVQDYLRTKRVLLLLDTFEHLLSAAPVASGLLGSCPGLKILATSRETLRVQAERVIPVPPLRLPSRGQREEVVRCCESVRLFCDRAAAVCPAFDPGDDDVEVVAEICRRLDGLPLSIELAAARISVLTPSTLLKRLENRLSVLTEGPRDLPERQRALRCEINWSHELLDSAQQRLFRRLAVFPGGCTLEAAEAVCRMEGEELDVFSNLTTLAGKSLLRSCENSGKSRFRLLDTIREYGLERLRQSGEFDAVQRRLADYFLGFAEQAETELYGPDQLRWFDRFEEELANLKAALACFHEGGRTTEGLRLAGAMGWFWFRRGHFADGRYWLELFRASACSTALPGPRAKAAYYLGWLAVCAGSAFWGNPGGKRFFRESRELWRAAGDWRGVALSQVWLGWKEEVEGADAWALAEESVTIARDTADPWTIGWCLKVAYSHLRRQDRNLDSRREALEEAISLARKTGDPFLLCQALNGMGNVFAWIGELEAAEPWYRDSLRIAREIDDSWSILDNLNCLADGCLGLGHTRNAKELFAEGLRLAMDLGARGYLAWFIGGFYGVARREGRARRAARLGAFSESILNPGCRFDPRFAAAMGLEEAVAAEEWKTGEAMSLEQAVAYALTED